MLGDSSDDDSGDTINVVGYSVLEQANEGVIDAFNDTDAGKDVEVKGSYGASGDQSRAVVAGQKADEVHLSLEPDVTRLVDEGLVAEDWKDNDTKGICTKSVVVIVVKSGNPKGIDSWDDLTKPGVGIVTPNPASSGSAKWNLLAAYGSVTGDGGTEAEADDVHEELLRQRRRAARLAAATRPPPSPAAPATCCSPTRTRRSSPARAARTSTTSSPTTLLIENPCALTEDATRLRPRRSSTSRRARTARSRLRRDRLPPARRRR